jgi:hypothetical protein
MIDASKVLIFMRELYKNYLMADSKVLTYMNEISAVIMNTLVHLFEISV